MSIIAWILLGIVAGVVANQLTGKRGDGLIPHALLGIAGAAVAGFAFNFLAGRAGGLSVWGLLVSLLGAGVVLAVSSAIAGRSAPATVRTRPSKRVRR